MSSPYSIPNPHRINSACTYARSSTDALLQQISLALPKAHIPTDLTREQCESVLTALGGGKGKRAQRMVACRPLTIEDRSTWGIRRTACKYYRACAYCSVRWADGKAEKLIAAIYGMASPTAILVTAPTRSLLDLRSGLETFRADLLRLRRRAEFRRRVSAGVLAIELPQTADGHRWLVHAHGALDLQTNDLIETAEWSAWACVEWRKIRGQQGAEFSLEPLRSPAALAKYSLKIGRDTKSWFEPSVPERFRERVAQALKRKRLIVSWGVGR